MRVFCAIVLGLLISNGRGFSQHRPSDLGKVHFATSCSPAVQADFDRGVALLHSFWYSESQRTFESITARDPKCAMAYWGEAMTRYHQLWGPNNVDDPGGKAAVAHAREVAANATARERGFIEAIGAYYDAAEQSTPRQRAGIYAERMAKVYAENPEDDESAAFYGLALVATADPTDRTFTQRKKAAEILKKVQAHAPQHPGVAHYLIHAYDAPELAQQGLPAAREYARIAPAAPHALHMPAHIFTQLGLWNEAIATDINAVAAAKNEEQHEHEHGMSGGRLHSYDFMEFAYLQRGDDVAAKKLVDEINGPTGPAMTKDVSTQHAMMSIPARYYVERKDWASAEKMTIPQGLDPLFESIIRMARGLGAAHLGHVDAARKEITAMQDIEGKAPALWKPRAHIQWLIVAGTLAHAEHQDEQAISILKTAQESVETSAGMPPPIVPCREALADVLLDMGKNEDALQQYQASEELNPNRFNTVAGAYRAARQAGKTAVAKQFADRLLKLTQGVATDRAIVKEAAVFVAASQEKRAGK